MSNMFSMLKDAAAMQMKMRKFQKELDRQVVECEHQGVSVVAKGDMSLRSIKISPTLMTGKPDAIEKALLVAANSALAAVKKQAAEQMAKMSGGMGGLADMLKGM